MCQKSVMAWSRQQTNQNTKASLLSTPKRQNFWRHRQSLVCETDKTKIGESENGGILLFCVLCCGGKNSHEILMSVSEK